MLLRFLILLLLFSNGLSQLHDKRQQVIHQVRNRLRTYESNSRTITSADTLQNSNKIGLGYDLLGGSPVCYEGTCQMNDFKRAIFKLKFTNSVLGSCTDKLVPDHIELDCPGGIVKSTNTEIIETVQHVHTSISNRVQLSIGAKYKGVGFSYTHSRETQYMVDNIVKNYQSSLFTTAEVSYIKLSMFEPFMELSDAFRYVIENMPCCEENDSDIEEYVKNFIFDYF
ncbi:hypothetical protein I4U23_010894 [Adineta vaga]|nr:hypothetical protein I4U23_010894 [Adineta vaga]